MWVWGHGASGCRGSLHAAPAGQATPALGLGAPSPNALRENEHVFPPGFLGHLKHFNSSTFIHLIKLVDLTDDRVLFPALYFPHVVWKDADLYLE